MTALYSTNGTTSLFVGRGVSGSLIGVSSADGVNAAFNESIDKVFSDENGPAVPSEQLINGGNVLITAELWKVDQTVLNGLIALREGGTLGRFPLGNQILAGKLMYFNGLYFQLTLASPIGGRPIFFPCCTIIEDASEKLSTQLTIWRLKIEANVAPVNTDFAGYLYQYI